MEGTHEMAILTCSRHEMGRGQSKQQVSVLQFPYEHALGDWEAIYCCFVSVKHIKGGERRGGDQFEGKKEKRSNGLHEKVLFVGGVKNFFCAGGIIFIIKKMSGSGINVEENFNRLDEFHIYAHLHIKPARVLTLHGTLVNIFSVDEADPSMEIRRQMLEPYLRRAGFYYASLIKRFEYDNPMISALVERWRPETHTFHLPWGECTITLEDVVMQVGLPIDGEPVSGTLRSWSKFHQRDIWQWCEKLLGEVPDGHVGITKYNIKLKWLRSRLQQMPLDSPEEALVRLPFWAPDVMSPYTFPLATTWAGKRGKNDYAEQRLQRHRLRLNNLKVDEVTIPVGCTYSVEGACGISWSSTWGFLYGGRATYSVLLDRDRYHR
ncbi:uncharacterized protein DS421_3g98570 [Arachis hypogaea]|nr:uncharacterized protein DS421_3g98570 [Arachis hypogaea]